MKEIDISPCEAQLLVCTHERPDGLECCSKVGGLAIFQKFKSRCKEENRQAHHWVNRTGCLGFCNSVGTTVAIHKKDGSRVWFNEVQPQDIEPIWDQFTK